MSQRTMDCAEIRDALLEGAVPTGPDVDAHVAECTTCAELLADEGELGRVLSEGDPAKAPNPELWATFERELSAESGPRAWLRSRSTPVRVLFAVSVAVAIVAYGGRAAPGAVPIEHPLVSLVAFTLVALALFWVLVAPLGRSRPTRELSLAFVVGALLLPLVHALFSSASLAPTTELGFAAQAFGCFVYGSILALPFLAVVWALERSDRPWLALAMGFAAVAGLVANLALTLHCPNTEPLHVAAGHATIGVALAVVGALWSFVAARRTS